MLPQAQVYHALDHRSEVQGMYDIRYLNKWMEQVNSEQSDVELVLTPIQKKVAISNQHIVQLN